MRTSWIGGFALLLAALPAAAEIRIAATTPNMGLLAETIGGDAVDVTVMAPHDRDAHYLEARPSMMAALRRADMVVSVGAELEVGWLPAAIDGAANPDVRAGGRGYFEGARHTDLIGVGGAADRAQGDVHPEGNPHFYMDPERFAEVGEALADRLARFDEDRADGFHANAADLAAAVDERMPAWREAATDAPGVVLYHEDSDYLMAALNVPIHGFLEPLPGVPPTASHLRELVDGLQGERGVVIHRNYQPADGAEFLQREIGWPVHSLPADIEPGADLDAYFDIIEQYVEAVTDPDA